MEITVLPFPHIDHLPAILDAVQHNREEIDKLELFTGMMPKAWYTVCYFHVSFG